MSGHGVLVALVIAAAALGIPGAIHGGLWLAFRSPGRGMGTFWGGAAFGDLASCAADLRGGQPAHAVGFAFAAVVAAVIAWRLLRRKRKDRARKLLGAKSKALRDALVRKARELSVPRPVLAPGGAR